MLQTLRRYAVVPTLLITVCYGEAVSGQDAGASLDALRPQPLDVRGREDAISVFTFDNAATLRACLPARTEESSPARALTGALSAKIPA